MKPVYIIGPKKTPNQVATWHVQKDGSQRETLCKSTLKQIVGLQDTYPTSGVCPRCLAALKLKFQQEREARK